MQVLALVLVVASSAIEGLADGDDGVGVAGSLLQASGAAKGSANHFARASAVSQGVADEKQLALVMGELAGVAILAAAGGEVPFAKLELSDWAGGLGALAGLAAILAATVVTRSLVVLAGLTLTTLTGSLTLSAGFAGLALTTLAGCLTFGPGLTGFAGLALAALVGGVAFGTGLTGFAGLAVATGLLGLSSGGSGIDVGELAFSTVLAISSGELAADLGAAVVVTGVAGLALGAGLGAGFSGGIDVGGHVLGLSNIKEGKTKQDLVGVRAIQCFEQWF